MIFLLWVLGFWSSHLIATSVLRPASCVFAACKMMTTGDGRHSLSAFHVRVRNDSDLSQN